MCIFSWRTSDHQIGENNIVKMGVISIPNKKFTVRKSCERSMTFLKDPQISGGLGTL